MHGAHKCFYYIMFHAILDLFFYFCIKHFLGIAEELVTLVPGCSVFLFCYADKPDMKSLADKRRSLGWFKKKQKIHMDSLKADIGPKPSQRHGITG